MVNVHASLLPRWRGAAPVHRAVIAGDRETGITIMRVVKELDAGASFKKARRAIGDDETSVEVERDLAEMGAGLLLEVLEEIAEGRARETPQDASLATYAAKITKAEGAVEWSLPAERIHNLVRGLQPWPLVSGRIGGARVLIHRTALTSAVSPDAPGHDRARRAGPVRGRRRRRPRAAAAQPSSPRGVAPCPRASSWRAGTSRRARKSSGDDRARARSGVRGAAGGVDGKRRPALTRWRAPGRGCRTSAIAPSRARSSPARSGGRARSTTSSRSSAAARWRGWIPKSSTSSAARSFNSCISIACRPRRSSATPST